MSYAALQGPDTQDVSYPALGAGMLMILVAGICGGIYIGASMEAKKRSPKREHGLRPSETGWTNTREPLPKDYANYLSDKTTLEWDRQGNAYSLKGDDWRDDYREWKAKQGRR